VHPHCVKDGAISAGLKQSINACTQGIARGAEDIPLSKKLDECLADAVRRTFVGNGPESRSSDGPGDKWTILALRRVCN